jgi:hypothetical protein
MISGQRRGRAGVGRADYLTVQAADGHDGDLAGQVRLRTDGFGADAAVVTVTTETSDVINAAVSVLRPGGVVVGVGQFGMGLSRDRWFGAQATILPSIAYGPGRYDPVYEENNWDYPVSVVRWTENRNMAAFLRLVAEIKSFKGRGALWRLACLGDWTCSSSRFRLTRRAEAAQDGLTTGSSRRQAGHGRVRSRHLQQSCIHPVARGAAMVRYRSQLVLRLQS